jgi:regulator of sigma E protease
MAVIAAGPAANVLLAFAIVWVTVMLFLPKYDPHAGWRIGAVVQKSAAGKAGVHPGDRLVRWNGVDVTRTEQQAFVSRLKSSRGKPIDLVVRTSSGGERSYHLVPTHITGSGTSRKLVGVTTEPVLRQVGRERHAPLDAAQRSTHFLWLVTVEQVHGISRLVTGEGRKQVSSVVGIVQAGDDAHKVGALPTFVALISLVIAIMNLLPLLPLDGGHLLFGLLEAARRGRPVPRGVFERASVVGIAVMLMLFVIGLNNDIGRMAG